MTTNFRYDYENVDATGANLMMNYMEPQLPGYVGMTLKANNQEFTVVKSDNYEYVDPVDGSVAKNQVKFFLENYNSIYMDFYFRVFEFSSKTGAE